MVRLQLLDRTQEKAAVESFLQPDPKSSLRVLWVEGDSGVGKTDLLRYALERGDEITFRFEDGTGYHKCRRGDRDQSFGMLTPVIGALALNYPDAFARVTGSSSRRLPVPALAQILVHLTSSVPYLKEAKALYDPEIQDERSARTWFLGLARDSLASRALGDFIVDAIRQHKPNKRILFAIDDVSWLDLASLRVLIAAARRLVREGFEFLFAMTAPPPGAADNAGSPEEVRAALRDYAELSIVDLQVGNLGFDDTRRVIAEAGKHLNPEEERYVFNLTKGNFAELGRLLRSRDTQIRVMYEQWRSRERTGATLSHRAVTEGEIRSLLAQHAALAPVLAILVLLDNFITVAQLRDAVRAVEQDSTPALITRDDLKAILAPALTAGAIQIVGEHVVADSAVLVAARGCFLADGTYADYGQQLVRALSAGALNVSMGAQAAVARAIAIQNEFSPERSLELFGSLPTRGGAPCDREVLLGAARAFALAYESSPVLPRAAWITGAHLLGQLTRQSCFEAGCAVGRILHNRRDEADHGNWFGVLSNLLRCMREAGELGGSPPWWILGEELVTAAPNEFDRCHSAILLCSALEHLGEYHSIRSAFAKVREFLERHPNDPRSHVLAIDYRRNLGLAYFHGDVISEYERALDDLAGARTKLDDLTRLAFEASVRNHLGLAHFHTGRLADATMAFNACLEILTDLGIRTETPLNNLGATSLVLGRSEEALGYLERARDVPLKPQYQSLSIDINLSVCLAKLGRLDYATRLIEPIAQGARPIPDQAVLSHARANYGYVLMLRREFARAAEQYALSNEHRFRFLEPQRRQIRERLTKYCAARAGIIAGEDIGDMSFVDFRESGYVPVRRPYQLDLNSLYVV